MPKKKPNKKAVIVTDPKLAEQVARDDYGDVCIGKVVNGVAYAEPVSVPAARRREEIDRERTGK